MHNCYNLISQKLLYLLTEFIPLTTRLLPPLYMCPLLYVKCEKKSQYAPGQTLRFPGVWGSQISRQSAHEVSKVVSPTHRPPLPREIFLLLISVRGWVDPKATVRPEGLCQWKIPMTQSGSELTTFRPVAQCYRVLTHPIYNTHYETPEYHMYLGVT